MVRTSSGWRKQVAKWQAEIRVSDDDGAAGADDEDEDPPKCSNPSSQRKQAVVSNPITLTCRDRVVSEESLYMELLAAEHNDEEPDAGAQEGFGDDYDG
ncbi:hypothetical protein B0H11DRAFT_2247461 [Mycena galericulata]|nr:hypothetical protein B0H11DRAFT_2247461 [Mycena galericulata]